MAQNRHHFPTTSWPLVHEAGAAAGGSPALEELLRRYLPALQAHLCQVKRMPADEAENLVQAFILDKVIQQELIARADQQKGRFRTFLLTVLDNYARNAWRRESPRRRMTRSLDAGFEPREMADEGEPAPNAAFDVGWARAVLAESLQRMERQCRTGGHQVAWEVFRSRVLNPILHGAASESYDTLVQRLNLQTPAQAHNALATAKRMFRRALHLVVSEYARDEAEVEQEIAELRQVLANAKDESPMSWGDLGREAGD